MTLVTHFVFLRALLALHPVLQQSPLWTALPHSSLLASFLMNLVAFSGLFSHSLICKSGISSLWTLVLASLGTVVMVHRWSRNPVWQKEDMERKANVFRFTEGL